jgi:cytochrome c-type biogenesis protein CcmE
LHCILQIYNGTKEVKNARLIEFKKNPVNIDLSTYTQATIKEAREAAVGTKVRVSGVVAAITYANGMKSIGFVLVDNTQSIYV